MLQANIHHYMEGSYGDRWFESKNAGNELMSLWSMGQKFNADEISNLNGGKSLSTSPLLENIKGILIN
jgi:hypothetical protein